MSTDFEEIVKSIPIEPYYKDGSVCIYCADCKKVLPLFHDKSFDFVLADPPYNVGKDYGEYSSDELAKGEYVSWCKSWFIELRRITECLALTIGITNLPMWIADIERTHKIIAWIKENQCCFNYLGVPSGSNVWEPVLIYGRASKCIKRDSFNIPISVQKGVGDHPCPKPLKAWEWLVNNFTEQNDLILDPFLGSGTTAVAAKILGRKCIGIEIEEKYCKIAAVRCQQSVMRLDFPKEDVAISGRLI